MRQKRKLQQKPTKSTAWLEAECFEICHARGRQGRVRQELAAGAGLRNRGFKEIENPAFML
jgi:hypothetical protein